MFSAAISSLLKNWTGMDCEKAKEFIRSCQVVSLLLNLVHLILSFTNVIFMNLRTCFPCSHTTVAMD